jgi:hypothetical protein
MKYIFIGIGSIVILMDIILCFGIKDKRVKHPEEKAGPDGVIIERNGCSMFKLVFAHIWTFMKEHREFIICMLGNFMFRVSSIAMYQYGPMYI